jgi:hypothetical protein
MAISRKPKAERVNVDALINKGGSVARQGSDAENEPVSIIFRIPGAMLQRVDKAVGARPIKTPRNMWLLEAVLEKLERKSN